MFVVWVQKGMQVVRGNTIVLKLGAEDGGGDAIPHDFDALAAHEYVPLSLDNMLEVLVHGDIIGANKEIKKLKGLKE